MGDKQECDTKSSNGGNMDSLPYNWTGNQDDQLFTQPRPKACSLSKLAELISRVEYKPKHQQSSNCKDCSQSFPNLDSLVDHQEREHALQKLHRCQHCGQKFALLSSLQIHKCPSPSPMCQACSEKPRWDSACCSCGTEPSGAHPSEEPFYHDNSPYACAPCGQAFSHKQELLYHQQAGECQPAPLSPSSPDAPSTPSYASLSPTCTRVSSLTCTACSRTFRSHAGLASHRFYFHDQRKRSRKMVTSDMSFPCRSCDKVFTQTSLLYLHRKEEHRREVMDVKPQRTSGTTKRRRKGDTYPCLHCGKVFLHHLTRWAHFRHFSAHHQTHLALSSKSTKAGKVGFKPKAGNVSRSLKEGKRLRGRPRTKFPPALMDSEEVKTDDQAALEANEEVHPPADTCRCCSVCTGEMSLPDIPENCEKNIYHCVPCAEAFIDLETFLEHCQKHLIRESEEDEDLLSD